MQELSSDIVNFVTNQGGKVAREAVFAEFTPLASPAQIQRAIELGKASGMLKKVLVWDAVASVANHTIELP